MSEEKLSDGVELSADKLKDVTGGAYIGPAEYEPPKDLIVKIDSSNARCPKCSGKLNFSENRGSSDIFVCADCGAAYRHIFSGDVWIIEND